MSARTSIAIRFALSFAVVFTAAPLPLHAQAFAVEETTIAQVHEAFRSGDLTCEGLVESYLARVDAYDKQGPRLNSIAVVNPPPLEEARAPAILEVGEGRGQQPPVRCCEFEAGRRGPQQGDVHLDGMLRASGSLPRNRGLLEGCRLSAVRDVEPQQ